MAPDPVKLGDLLRVLQLIDGFREYARGGLWTEMGYMLDTLRSAMDAARLPPEPFRDAMKRLRDSIAAKDVGEVMESTAGLVLTLRMPLDPVDIPEMRLVGMEPFPEAVRLPISRIAQEVREEGRKAPPRVQPGPKSLSLGDSMQGKRSKQWCIYVLAEEEVDRVAQQLGEVLTDGEKEAVAVRYGDMVRIVLGDAMYDPTQWLREAISKVKNLGLEPLIPDRVRVEIGAVSPVSRRDVVREIATLMSGAAKDWREDRLEEATKTVLEAAGLLRAFKPWESDLFGRTYPTMRSLIDVPVASWTQDRVQSLENELVVALSTQARRAPLMPTSPPPGEEEPDHVRRIRELQEPYEPEYVKRLKEQFGE